MKLKFILSFLLSFFIFQPCFSKVLARVGSTQITVKSFLKKLDNVREQSINPPKPSYFLNDLIRYETGLLEAKKQKIDQDPNFKERMNQELYKIFVDKKLGASLNRIQVSSGEMRSYYRKNPEVKTSHILIKTDSYKYDVVRRAERAAFKVLGAIQSKKISFNKAAKKYSDDQRTKASGGALPYLGEASLVPAYYQASKKLKPGKIHYAPVRSTFGFHIIRLDGVRSYKKADKAQMRIALINRKRKKIFEKYFKNLSKKYKVSINQDLLKQIK